MNTKMLMPHLTGVVLLAVVLTACGSATPAVVTPTPLIFVTETLPVIITDTASALTVIPPTVILPTAVTPLNTPVSGDSTAVPGVTATAPAPAANFCQDPQVTALIDSFKKAITTGDGPLLASLVSPTNGMDVAFYHNGNVINYDQQHAQFLFETTFEADWGAQPASGEATIGSFHDVVVPELVKSFNQPYTLHCNELKYGGASYPVNFPYQKDFYSIYYPGTDANGNMDWHTWVMGIEYVNGKPYIYALTQFFWEP